MKVSIAIPAFKGKFLKESIESVLNQTYDDFELIIVDDQSPHHLEDLIGEFSDKRIKYSMQGESSFVFYVMMICMNLLSYKKW